MCVPDFCLIAKDHALHAFCRVSKERDWAKDNEILKLGVTQQMEWLQALQRDVADMRNSVHAIKLDTVQKASAQAEESARSRAEAEALREQLESGLALARAGAERGGAELRALSAQRMEDLEVMEKASSGGGL
jgi:hypothetical protein